ncbi:MAG: hypothetical protein M3082_08700 [Candidatus Dormibacteraeota bacterium]|nr:hypothetical protein [Candidatus Dormibacteraeota bacterium]
MYLFTSSHMYLFTTHLTRNKEIAVIVVAVLVVVAVVVWVMRRRRRRA